MLTHQRLHDRHCPTARCRFKQIIYDVKDKGWESQSNSICDMLPTVTIVPRYSNSVILDTLQDNHLKYVTMSVCN